MPPYHKINPTQGFHVQKQKVNKTAMAMLLYTEWHEIEYCEVIVWHQIIL